MMPPDNKAPRVLITEAISMVPTEAVDLTWDYRPDLWQNKEQLASALQGAAGLIVRNQTRVDQTLLAEGNQLQVIGRLGAGLDNIDLAAADDAGIQVVYAPESNTTAVAEFCLAQILNILRNLPDAINSTRTGSWDRSKYTGRELSEATVGLVGFGRVARALAERLTALKANILVATRSPEKVLPEFNPVSLDALLAAADIVSLHVPGGEMTRKLIGGQQLERMKPSAWLLNASRGSVVDETALFEALRSGSIGGAVVDVRESEPPPPGGLAALDNFYATPHIAAFTEAAQTRVNQTVFSDVAAVIRGSKPVNPARISS